MDSRLFYWPAIILWSAVGILTCAFLIYPPVCGWGEKIAWGDAAAWFSGLCAVAAVVVALYLARVGDRQREADRAKLARILAEMSLEDLYATIAHLKHFLLTIKDDLFRGSIQHTLTAISKAECPALSRCVESLPTFDVGVAVEIGRAHAKLLAVSALARNNIPLCSGWDAATREIIVGNVIETTELTIDVLHGVFQGFIKISGQPQPLDPRKDGESTFNQKKNTKLATQNYRGNKGADAIKLG